MSDEYIDKVNRARNKSFEHLTDTLESFIYCHGILNSYDIETFSDVDYKHNEVSDTLTITINMSRNI